jgi:hypothetical protein
MYMTGKESHFGKCGLKKRKRHEKSQRVFSVMFHYPSCIVFLFNLQEVFVHITLQCTEIQFLVC